ncbi:hypothetical protein T10_150 [Trichinella papuae]|uniref:Uncharacterized protein n=1 Tax=Trichinella papuae TaxID=268474 RepID=A0A0V1N9A0_9BILA|nr:hypothetical protein T10_150 [Trichinella papuae]
MKLFSGFFTTIIQKRACNLRIYLSFHLRNYFDFYLNSAVKSFDDDLFGTYNDMPLKQNPEMIKLQSCLCERTELRKVSEFLNSKEFSVHGDIAL